MISYQGRQLQTTATSHLVDNSLLWKTAYTDIS